MELLYWAHFGYFVAANGIPDAKLVPTFLSLMGSDGTFNLFCSLLQPAKQGTKTFAEIVDTLNFSPKPLVIAERLRFHKCNQEDGESVTLFVASWWKLAEPCEFGEALLFSAVASSGIFLMIVVAKGWIVFIVGKESL